MEELLEQIIHDFHERPLPDLVPREAEMPELTGKIDTIIGMRRSGKTFFLFQNMWEKLESGIAKERLLYINFDDERFLPFTVQQLQLIPIVYYRLYPELKNQKCYFFFDEIQNVAGWEKFIRRLVDTENVHLVLTGSSAKLLSKEIGTSLRGRSIATEIFPFSYREFLTFMDPDMTFSAHIGAQKRALLANRFKQFLVQGGFPEVQTVADEYRIRILQEYVDVVVLRDIVERHQVSNIHTLRAMVRCLLASPGTQFSVNKFYNDLKSQGIHCTKNALYEYLDYLADAYLVFPVPIFSRSERIRRTNPKKIYLIDTGLANAFIYRLQSDWRHLLENFVYIKLRKSHLKVEYYRTKNNYEVDFIVTSLLGEYALYQVSLSVENKETYGREVRALEIAMSECGLKKSYLITLNHRETIKVSSGIIEVFPAWQWAIGL